MGGVHDKILVGEAEEPQVGVWRQITHPQINAEECMGWYVSINDDGRSEAMIRKTSKGFEVWAKRKI